MKSLRPYAELVRLPNAFTACADILAGYWLAEGRLLWSAKLAALLASSICLYSAGMVINDICDIETDHRERPGRPLPSGRVALPTARWFAALLMIAGVCAAAVAGGGVPARLVEPLPVALALAAAILVYDCVTKDTLLGPPVMGLCRGLNLLLPMAAVGIERVDLGLTAIAAMTLYIASVTYFGRDEAGSPSQRRLVLGGLGIVAALVVAVEFVAWNRSDDALTLVLWLALIFHIGRMAYRCVRSPQPEIIRYAMKTFILGVIPLDATIAWAAVGRAGGLIILALLVPALVLGRRLYST